MVKISVVPVCNPCDIASNFTLSLLVPACISTWHLPLNKLRCQLPSIYLSGSWLLGSPLPTPIIFASPFTLNVMRLSASGTSRPCLSITLILITEPSLPNSFRPEIIRINRFVPPVYLTDFQIFNQKILPRTGNSPLEYDISVTKKITLTHKQSTFSFGFAALNYTASENNQYAYKLEGLDKTWNYVGNERKAS